MTDLAPDLDQGLKFTPKPDLPPPAKYYRSVGVVKI